MTKKYRLKVPQMGLPAGTEFERKEGTTFTGAFIEANPTAGVCPMMFSYNTVEDNPDLFEPVIERWHAAEDERYFLVTRRGDVDGTPHNGRLDDRGFEYGNYFRTQEQAEEAARRIKDVLMKYHAELAEEVQ